MYRLRQLLRSAASTAGEAAGGKHVPEAAAGALQQPQAVMPGGASVTALLTAAVLPGQGRFYAGRPIMCEFSPVTDFREATCRQYEENTCTRGGYCNFMHLRPISKCASPLLVLCAIKHRRGCGRACYL